MPAEDLRHSGSTTTVEELGALVKNRLKRMQYRPALITGFITKTNLSPVYNLSL